MRYLILFFFSIFSFSQQITKVDFKSVVAKITINPTEKTISGDVKYDFDVLQTVDTIKIDAKSMTITNVKVNNKEIPFRNTNKQLQLIFPFEKGSNKLTFSYSAKPKQALYFVGEKDNLQIWTQGQGRYTSNWFPSFDDMNEKVIFNLDITYDKNFQVISNGILKEEIPYNNKILWRYQMKNPMSSYLLMLAIGKFENQVLKSNSGIPLQLFIEPNDKAKFEPTYRYSKQIFDFLEKEIGVKYPWQIYKQIPVRDFLYAGMENTSATLFARDYVVDSTAFNDRNYINVNAHELAHQWFGDLVTAKSGKHHWLQEGFATYYALLAEKNVFGEDYFYNSLYGMAQELQEASKTDTIPILSEKASSLSYYQKGALALLVLNENVGHEKFQEAVKSYLQKYQYKNVETDDFLNEIKKVSGYDVSDFKKKWLESSTFDEKFVEEMMQKNLGISKLISIKKMKDVPFKDKKDIFKTLLISTGFTAAKEEVVYQLQEIPFDDKEELLEIAMKTNDLKVRQAIANSLTVIPEKFRTQYEDFLNDNSYETKAVAFINLIQNFPNHRKTYLDLTKGIIGFNDKNFEMLWMIFALSTENYCDKPQELVAKLSHYTASDFEFSVQQNAFVYLKKLDVFSEKNLNDLLSCCLMPNWRNSKWSKDFLKALLADAKYKKMASELTQKVIPEMQIILNNALK